MFNGRACLPLWRRHIGDASSEEPGDSSHDLEGQSSQGAQEACRLSSRMDGQGRGRKFPFSRRRSIQIQFMSISMKRKVESPRILVIPESDSLADHALVSILLSSKYVSYPSNKRDLFLLALLKYF